MPHPTFLQRAFAGVCLFAGTGLAQSATPALMPLPSHLVPGPGQLRIDAAFRIKLSGYEEPRLRRAAIRMIARLERQTGIPLAADPVTSAGTAALTIICEHAGRPVQAFGEDESYRLAVAPSGASLTAPQPLGVLRGMETFLQLVEPGPDGFDAAEVVIEDQPRFPWRGLLMDVSRHFMPLDEVERTLDGMAAVKFNVFHWHLSDNQGFRVESRLFPRLQEAGSAGLYYTQAQVREVVAYARDRGIRVIPEFDLPGHATAMLVAYPQLATAPPPVELDHLFGVFDPVLDPSKPQVYVFLDRLLGEMAQLFPDADLHIGGDEVNGRLWRESLDVREFKNAHSMTATPADPDGNAAFQAYFNRRLQAILQKHGKQMEGWDEILSPALPKSIVIQSWRGQKSLAAAVRLGYQGILSSGWYLDLMQPASEYYLIDPIDQEAAALSPEEQKRILGGEAAMWSEWVTPETMDSRIWPRAAAIAERLWSPREIRDVSDMYRRMDAVSGELEWLGLTHRSWRHLMLRRLAGSGDVQALEIFAEMLEPVKFYEREGFGPYTTTTPLNRLVDAVPPESEAARRFAETVANAVTSKRGWDAVRLQLTIWQDNQRGLTPLLEKCELLRGVSALSLRAAEMTAIGLEATNALEAGKRLDLSWKAHKMERIQMLGDPAAALTIAIRGPVLQLISAVSAN